MTFLRYFAYKHLPEHLRAISKPFSDIAESLLSVLPDGEAKEEALRELLKSKDAAVRSFAVDRKEHHDDTESTA